VCDRALKQLVRLNNEILKVGDVGKTDVALVEKIICDELKLTDPAGALAVSLQFLASMGGSMIDCYERDKVCHHDSFKSFFASLNPFFFLIENPS